MPRMGADYEIGGKQALASTLFLIQNPSLVSWFGTDTDTIMVITRLYGSTTAFVSLKVCYVDTIEDDGNLPGDCRPSGREIFNMNVHQYTSRVDVLSNGDIHWIHGRSFSRVAISFRDDLRDQRWAENLDCSSTATQTMDIRMKGRITPKSTTSAF